MDVEKSKKDKKKLFFGLLFVVALVVSATTAISYMNDRLKTRMEQAASEALTTKVMIDELSYSPVANSVIARGVTVANPAGFSDNIALKIGDLRINTQNTDDSVLEVKKLQVTRLSLFMEENEAGKNNLSTLLQNMHGLELQNPDNTQRVLVDTLEISEIYLVPTDSIIDHLPTPVQLPNVSLADIGLKNEISAGATQQRLLSQLITIAGESLFDAQIGRKVAQAKQGVLAVSRSMTRAGNSFSDTLDEYGRRIKQFCANIGHAIGWSLLRSSRQGEPAPLAH